MSWLGVAVFDVLDPATDRGQVYQALVARPRGSVDRISAQTGLPQPVVRSVLAELADTDVVVRVDASAQLWDACSPDRVTASVLRTEDDRRAGLWRVGAELDRVFRVARSKSDAFGEVEVIDDPALLRSQEHRLQLRASEQVRGIDRPPHDKLRASNDVKAALRRRRIATGLRYRTIYDQSAYADPCSEAFLTAMVTHGELARILDDVPIELTIGDDRIAVLVPDLGLSGFQNALILHPSGLLSAIIGLFETLWRLAVPVSAEGMREPLGERDREIITLMASGATDDAIARRLCLSRRTVVRRTGALLDRLGATTRFQAGVQAAHRGWL